MCAVKISLTEIENNTLREKIMSSTREHIPLGFNHHKKARGKSLLPPVDEMPQKGIVLKEYQSARKQVGTLGGGNHFIEIQKGSDNHIWIMIHSGSRNIGKKVADYYNKQAKQINAEINSSVPPKWDLAYLPLETNQAGDYLTEMQYCIDFAFANRSLMMTRILSVFHEVYPGEFSSEPMINIAHNYASEETHFGEKVMVHRKGATKAAKGQPGIIPGSQGTESYIVKVSGNPESFESCSHGAGRVMGRKQAISKFNLEEVKKMFDDKNIIHSIRQQKDLDEAPDAYKDITTVMQNQSDLVDIVLKLKPLAVIKG